jgi:hypothetical protein
MVNEGFQDVLAQTPSLITDAKIAKVFQEDVA